MCMVVISSNKTNYDTTVVIEELLTMSEELCYNATTGLRVQSL